MRSGHRGEWPPWPLALTASGARYLKPRCAPEKDRCYVRNNRVKNVATVRAIGSNRPGGAAVAIRVLYGFETVEKEPCSHSPKP